MQKVLMETVNKNVQWILVDMEDFGLSREEALQRGRERSCLGPKYWQSVVKKVNSLCS